MDLFTIDDAQDKGDDCHDADDPHTDIILVKIQGADQ